MFKRLNWKIFVILFVPGLLGVLAVLPFTFELIERGAFGQLPEQEMPLPIIIALGLVQNGVLLAVVILIGMSLSKRVGLEMPLIQALANRQPLPNLKRIVASGILVGAAAGAILVAIDALFFVRQLPKTMLALFEIPLWKRLLAGVLYGGITEELLMRLFLVSLIAWLLGKFWKQPSGMPTPAAFWTAIIVVAILFGLGHLPATAMAAPLTPVLVTRALVLNGVVGVAFGYLYWRFGLEAAMLGHMSTHLVMQLPGVILIKSLL